MHVRDACFSNHAHLDNASPDAEKALSREAPKSIYVTHHSMSGLTDTISSKAVALYRWCLGVLRQVKDHAARVVAIAPGHGIACHSQANQMNHENVPHFSLARVL